MIDKLNRKLDDLKRRMYRVDAIDLVARNAGLVLLADGGDCRIYQTVNGKLINCWIDAPDEEDNGFDDQVEWYTDKDRGDEPEPFFGDDDAPY